MADGATPSGARFVKLTVRIRFAPGGTLRTHGRLGRSFFWPRRSGRAFTLGSLGIEVRRAYASVTA